MSYDIPFEIQIEIIKNIPIKSLIRFRTVSKPRKSLIESSKFINDYTLLHHAQTRQHMLIRYNRNNEKYFSAIDNDDSFFPERKTLYTPPSVKQLKNSVIVGSSHGLLCLFGYYRKEGESADTPRAVIWNPSIRKSVAIDTPDVISNRYEGRHAVGFGVCPEYSIDPKIVWIDDLPPQTKMENVTCNYWQVKVFTLSLGVWRSKLNHAPLKSINVICSDYVEVIDRFIYWIAHERSATGDGLSMILSFDLTSEEFKKIYLPNKVAARDYMSFPIFKLRESLVLVQRKERWNIQVYTVWRMMENGFSKSFRKLFNFNLPFAIFRTLVGFRNNDQLIMETSDNSFRENKSSELVAYELCSERIENIWIYGDWGSFVMRSYKESLLLLNQPNTIIGYENDGQIARCGN